MAVLLKDWTSLGRWAMVAKRMRMERAARARWKRERGGGAVDGSSESRRSCRNTRVRKRPALAGPASSWAAVPGARLPDEAEGGEEIGVFRAWALLVAAGGSMRS